MGKMKELLIDEMEVMELYEKYMDNRLEGLPMEAIPEAESYLRRHWIEYLMFLSIMEPSRYPEELCDDESCKRDFLMYKIHGNIENPNIGVVLNGIYNYVEEHLDELQ